MITASTLLLEALIIILGNADFLTILAAFVLIVSIITAIIFGWKFTWQRIERSR